MQKHLKKPEYTLGLLGCGNMGEAIISGILKAGFLVSGELAFFDISQRRCKYISAGYRIACAESIEDLVKNSGYILVAVKPQNIFELLDELKKSFNPEYNKIISIAAGVPATFFEKNLGGRPSIIRVMPNTPALVNKGMSVISRGKYVTDDDFEFASGVFKTLGDCIAIEESFQNIATAISGSGPAYFFLFCKYLIESAADRGIDRETVEKLVIRTMAGAARMLEKVSTDTDFLISMVASPGGTTEKAILEFNKSNIKEIISSAVSSAEKRAEEIQEDLEKHDF